MKFTINQSDLYQAINIVQKAVSRKETLPILSGIYLETNKNKGLHLMANNLELGIEYWIDAEVEDECAIVLPANNLISLVRELPSENIVFNIDMDSFQAEIKCLESEFIIKGFDPEEFPSLPSLETSNFMKINGKILKSMIEKVKFSISNNQTQPALTGTLFEINKESMALVATNTYRLACYKVKNKTNLENKHSFIIPGETISNLNSLLTGDEDLEMIFNKNYAKFKFNDIILISRLIEGQFPNYEQVIPDKYNTSIIADKIKLNNSAKRASLIANVVNLNIVDESLIIESTESESGHAHEKVDIKIDGPEQNINIDANYLLDVIKVMDEEEINIKLIDSINPLAVKIKNENEDYTYLIMPVRPNS